MTCLLENTCIHEGHVHVTIVKSTRPIKILSVQHIQLFLLILLIVLQDYAISTMFADDYIQAHYY